MSGAGLAVLVADERPTRRRVLADAARALGASARVEFASSVAIAVARLESSAFDLVVVDLPLAETGLDDLLLAAHRSAGVRVVLVGDPAGRIAPRTLRAVAAGAASLVPREAAWDDRTATRRLGEALAGLLRERPAVPAEATGRASIAPAPSPSLAPLASARSRFWMAAIGISTGGPEALGVVVPGLPADFPLPLLIVQHMPPVFTASLAQRLDRASPLRVVEAQDADVVLPGIAYIAPGGRHMTVEPDAAGRAVIALRDDPPVHACRPAADVLFQSLARFPERRGVLAAVMTGMGYDGLNGVRALKSAADPGAATRGVCLTQSEATCVVYGMPRAVDAAGLSDESVPLERMADRLTFHARRP